jgi:ribonucleoside-diphosphate reductase alpha chain
MEMNESPPLMESENLDDVQPNFSLAESARAMGFTGDICTNCNGSQMVRNGTCLKCNECGETTGCS